MMTKNDLHAVVEPFVVQNNIIEATIGTETYSTELTTGTGTCHDGRGSLTKYMMGGGGGGWGSLIMCHTSSDGRIG